MSPDEPAPTGDGRPAEDGHGLPPGYLLRPMTVWDVPEVLMSGHHGHIAQWRREQSRELTRRRRPDLLTDE